MIFNIEFDETFELFSLKSSNLKQKKNNICLISQLELSISNKDNIYIRLMQFVNKNSDIKWKMLIEQSYARTHRHIPTDKTSEEKKCEEIIK